MFEIKTQSIMEKGKKHRMLLPFCKLALCVLFGWKAIRQIPATIKRKIKGAAGRNHTAFVQRPARRFVAALLAVSMILSMTGGFTFATDEGADGGKTAIGTSLVDSGSPDETVEPETSGTPDETKCSCPPVDSGEVVHDEDCPLYEATDAPVCLCEPVIDGDGAHTNPNCPLYVVLELPPCTCPEGVWERFHSHVMECLLYDGPSEEEFAQESVVLPDDHAPAQAMGETQTKAARSARAVPPVGETYVFSKENSGNLSFSRYAENQPMIPMELVIEVPNAFIGSDNVVALNVTSQKGMTFSVELNGTQVLEDLKVEEQKRTLIVIPISSSNVRKGENIVRLKFSGFGDIKCHDARILLGGGAQSDKIIKAFDMLDYTKGETGGELTLRSEISGVQMVAGMTQRIGFQYAKGTSKPDARYSNIENNGLQSYTHTESIENSNNLTCQIFLLNDDSFTAYQAKCYRATSTGEINKFAVSSRIGPQVATTADQATYRTVTIEPNPASSLLTVTGCTVAGYANPSYTAQVNASGNGYTFDWGYSDPPNITLSYAGMGEGTQTYLVPDWSIDVAPPTFTVTTPVSLLTKGSAMQLEGMLRAGVSNYFDAQTPTPEAITVDITGVNLMLAGSYTATITAKDGMGNAGTKQVTVKVENPSVAIGKPTATPSGNDVAINRTFTAAITEPGGQTFSECGFVLGFSPMPTVESCVEKIVATGTDASFTASKNGLLANAQYYVRTFAKNTKGETYYSEALAFSCGAPGDYGALTAVDVLAEIQTGQTTVDATVTVNRSAGGIGSVTLDYEVVPGGLTTVSATSGKLTFAAGETQKTISIRITDAAAFNEVKSFQVKLTKPTPTTINGSESAAVTVGYSTANKTKLDPPGASSGCLLPSGIYNDAKVNNVAIFPHSGYLANLPQQPPPPWGGDPTPGEVELVPGNMPDNWQVEGGSYDGATIYPYIVNGESSNDSPIFRTGPANFAVKLRAALIATVDVSAYRGYAYAAGFQIGSYTLGLPTLEIKVEFFDAGGALIDAPKGTTVVTGQKAEYPCAGAVASLCSCNAAGTVTPGVMGSSDLTIPQNAKTAEVTFRDEGAVSEFYNFYFGVKKMAQLSFTRFDTDIAAGRSYYPGDQIRIYPVLNSAVDAPTGNILVNGTAVAYVPAQKAFVYTVPTGATGALAVTHNNVVYTVQGETSGAAWSKATPTGTAGTFNYMVGTLPTVLITGATTGNNITHSATVTATGGTAYYAWSQSATPPSGSWLAVPAGGKVSGSGYATAMYLHGKVTNADGKTVYDKQSFPFVTPSVFDVSDAPSGWQKSATATLTRTPATATTLTVKVSYNGGTATEVSGSSYPITKSGVYTFAATDAYGFSKTVTRSYSIDTTAPVITVNTGSYTEGYNYQTLADITATAKDAGGSELKALDYAWSNTAATPTSGFAAVPIGGVVPAQNIPNTWYLHLKATDKAGNEAVEKKGPYLVTATAPTPPTVEVTRAGNTGNYTVISGSNSLSMIIAPGKTGFSPTPTSGTFSIMKNGLYTVSAYDSQGVGTEKPLVVNDIDTDAPNVETSVWNGTEEAIYGTYVKANSHTVKVWVDDKLTPTYDVNGGVTGYFGTGATSFSWKKSGGTEQTVPLDGGKGSFEVTENGEYEITATDTAGNKATQLISVKSIDHTAPVITPVVPPANGWDPVGSTVNFTVSDAESGIQSVTVKKGDTEISVTGSYSFTTSGNGSYTITATDKVGNSASETVTVSAPATPTVITDSSNTETSMTYGELVKVGVSATVSDGGVLTYRWYKGSSAADTDPSGKTLLGTAAAYAQPTSEARLSAGSYYYFCVVTNTKGGETTDATGTITVTVQKKTPDFTLTVDKSTVVHGETIKLTATVSAAPGGSYPPGTVTFKDGETVLDTITVTRNITGHGEAVYNYAIPISHGTITATYTAAEAGNYNSAAPAEVIVTVNKKPLTITLAAADDLVYSGTPKTIKLTGVTGLTADADYTLTYSGRNSTTYGSTTAPTDAGDYTATFALTTDGAAKYDTGASTLTVDFAIVKAAGSGSVTCANIMFGGTVAPVPVSSTNGITNVTYLYKVKNADDNTYGADAPVDVGEYTVKATFAATTNYTEATDTADFEITPAAVTGITVTPYEGTYDGAAHDIVKVTGTQPGDQVFYQLPSSDYIETLPTVFTVADSKNVIVKVTRANHVDFVSEQLAAKVTAKEVAFTFTVPTDLVYNGSPKTVTAAITNQCGTDDVTLTLGNATGKAVGEYTTTVTALSGTDAGNYKLPETDLSVEWEITGTPYPHEITLPTASGITYGQKLSDSALTGDNGGTGVFTWNDGTILPPSGDYTATAVFTPNDTNYAPVTREVQVVVAKAEVTLEVSGTKAYHAAPIANGDFVVSNILGMVNSETGVPLLGTLAFTSTGNTADATVGSYDIAIAQSGASNYKVTTTAVTGKFTVTRATQSLSGTASYQKLLTDQDFMLDVKTDATDADAAVTYALTNDGSGVVTLDADGKTLRLHKTGTATITASAAQTANFAAATDFKITVTVGSMPTVRVLAPEGITTTEAQIGGTVTAGTIPMTGYGLEYKKSADAEYTAVSPTETVNGDVTTLAHSLVGLEKNTEYSVRVWAKTAEQTFASVTRFRTAAEQPPTGKVEGEITDASGENTAITVTIEAGNTVIASNTVKAGGGKFTFEALPDGIYNLVADNGKYKVTRMVQVVKGGAVTDIKMEIGKTQSIVEVKGEDTPKIAVDGLPELFKNSTLFTPENEDMIASGGTVEFRLTVEKTEASADAEEIGKIAEGKVGVYLDIRVLKTVTDQNGREQESKLMSDLDGNEITIVIPLPKELQGKQSYTVYRVHEGTAEKLDSVYNADSGTLTIQSSLFSTYAIAYTEKSGGGGGGSGGNSHDDVNDDFWQSVKEQIERADSGDVIKANAKDYDKMPWNVMEALRKDGVSLVVTWNGGETITIPAGKAQANEPGRIFWPLSLLEKLYAKITEDTVLKPTGQENLETGGIGQLIPVTGGNLYELEATTLPTTDTATGQAEMARTDAPPAITPPDAGFPPDGAVDAPDASADKINISAVFAAIAIMLAVGTACGMAFWKKKQEGK